MSKGGENERKIAKYLTKWISGEMKPFRFWRQDASGGLATVHIENTHMTGDICSIHPESKWFTDIFSIECKTGYPKTSFWQHFTSSKFGIEEFWVQALDDAKKANKHAMLIYRKKGRKWIVGVDRHVTNRLKKYLKDYNSIVVKWVDKEIDDCVLYDLDSFFSITPEQIKDKIWQL